MLTLITGGTRSGKSTFAQNRALSLSKTPIYIATAKAWDDEFTQRINRHIQERGPEWTTFEAHQELHTLPLKNKVVVIDCLTLWLTNYFSDFKMDVEQCLEAYKHELNLLLQIQAHFILITNEIGMGLHAHSESGRKFSDLQGWANQHTASVAEEVIFMVSGLPMQLKP